MAPSSKLALFAALNLVLLAAVHGCPTCGYNHPPVVVTPPPPPPAVPVPVPTPTPSTGTCPIDALKLSACANVLGLLKLNLGVPSNEQCCPLLSGLADLDAAVCLCTAIKANVLGIITLNVQVDLVLLLNYCNKSCPPSFTCPQ